MFLLKIVSGRKSVQAQVSIYHKYSTAALQRRALTALLGICFATHCM